MNYRLLLPLLLLCSTFSISAEERWFEVELLLFQRNVDIKDVQEERAIKNITIDTSNSISLLKPQADDLCAASIPCLHKKIPVLISNEQFDWQTNGFQLLDNEQLQLTAQREKLIKHASFEPLLHLAWRMPIDNQNSAKAIHLFAGNNYADKMPQGSSEKLTAAQQTLSENTQVASQLDLSESAIIQLDAAEMPTDRWAVDGNFKIYLDRYLFIDSQLLVRRKTTQEITAAATEIQEPQLEVLHSEDDVQVIKLQEGLEPPEVKKQTVISEALFDQNRRLRSGEIHYFDHPLMGMIVQIRKIAEQEVTE